MNSHFYVKQTDNGFELTFRTGNNKQLLKWMQFPDKESVKAFEKMIKRKADEKHFIIFPYRGKWYFSFMAKFKFLHCCSHSYSTKQKAEQGLTAFVREMVSAKITGLTEF